MHAGEAEARTDLEALLSTPWDFIVGSDLIYNEVGSRLLPRVILALSRPHTVTIYCHTKHRFDHLDIEFLDTLQEQVCVAVCVCACVCARVCVVCVCVCVCCLRLLCVQSMLAF